MSPAPHPAGLVADLQVSRGGFTLSLPLAAPPGGVLALLGPNGAGKSTALQALAGLLPLSAGEILLDGRVLDGPVLDGRGTFVAAAQRRVGMVFQDALLFPHLDARDNVAFGLHARGIRTRQARVEAQAQLERFGLAELARSRPAALSGGQAQLVALARALAPDPGLLLLDEPLSALDAETRVQVRSELRRHLDSFSGCTVLVTHDPLDAMVLADTVVVVEAGRVVQSGTPVELARAPRTPYVARLVGLNLYRGHASGDRLTLADGGSLQLSGARDGALFAAFRPSAVALFRSRPDGSARNCWRGTITALEQHAELVRVQLDGTPPVLADVTPAAVAELDLAPGARLWAAVKASEIATYPA